MSLFNYKYNNKDPNIFLRSFFEINVTNSKEFYIHYEYH